MSSPVRGEASAARDTAVVAALTLLSRLTGFARVVTIAAVLGVNRFTDLYQSINLLPNYAHELLTGSLVTALLVPPLVRHLDRGDLASMRRLAGGFLTLVAAAGLVLMLFAILAGSLVIRLLTLGVSDPAEQADLLRLGWPLLALLMPQVVLYATAAAGASVQHASGRFGLAAAAPLIENVVILVVLGLWAGLFGTGIESVAGVETGHVLFLGLGTTAAVLLHAALQWIGAARCGVLILPRPGWRDPEVREVVRRAMPSAAYTALNVGRLGVFLVAAGLVTGGQSAFLIALNFFNLPVALAASPLTTTAMPVLSRLRSDGAAFAERYLRSLGVMLFLVIPAAALMMGAARPIALMALWGSAGNDAAVALLAAAVATLALAIPAESVFIMSTSASYAKLDAVSPLRAMALRTVVGTSMVALSAYIFLSGSRPDWHLLAAIGLAMAWADACGAGFLASRVMAEREGLVLTVASHLPTGLAVFITVGSVAFLMEQLLQPTRLVAALALVIAVPAAAATVFRVETSIHGGLRVDFVGLARRELTSRWGRRHTHTERAATTMARLKPSTTALRKRVRRPVRAEPTVPLEPPTKAERPEPAESPDPVGSPNKAEAPVLRRAKKRRAKNHPSMRSVAPAAPTAAPMRRRVSWTLGAVGLGIVSLPLAAAAGLATAALGPVGPAVPASLAGLALLGLILWRPLAGPLTLLAVTPFVVGLGRGAVIPFLRLNEALLFAVAAVIGVHVMYRWARSERVELAAGGRATLDWAIGLLVLAATVIPLLVRFGRGLPISVEDALHTLVFVKFGLLYLVFRFAVRSADDVRRCLIVSMAASVPVAMLAVAQSMQLPGIAVVLNPWVDGQASAFVGRGAGTIGNSGALGDLMALHLGLALMLLFGHLDLAGTNPLAQLRSRWFAVLALIFAVGGLGSGQFSGFAATLITVVVVAIVAGRPRVLLAIPVVGSIAIAAVWPVIALRLQGFNNTANLPSSWQVRISNVQELVLPTLRRDFNWALGVRPDTTIDTPLVLNGVTFIESGFLWLLWAGGLALLSAFGLLMVIAFRRFRRAAKAQDPWLAAVGGAGLAATCFVAILTTVDPHITLRGFADTFYPLLAMSLVAAAAPARVPLAAHLRRLAMPPTADVGWLRYSYLTSSAKRALDLSVSATLLALLSPLLLAITIGIRVTSPGPALFRQTRVGFAERPFTILKFRTMRVDNDETVHRQFVQAMLHSEIPAEPVAEDEYGEFKLVDEERITRLGTFLRRTSLDELPQLINVVKGEMSLVGPRPSLFYEVTEYTLVRTVGVVAKGSGL